MLVWSINPEQRLWMRIRKGLNDGDNEHLDIVSTCNSFLIASAFNALGWEMENTFILEGKRRGGLITRGKGKADIY